MSEGNLAYPYEEGEDLPSGKVCPFWKGKQGREGECGNPLPRIATDMTDLTCYGLSPADNH